MLATLGRAWLRRTMERTLEFHQERVRRDLDRLAPGPPGLLRVLLTGASGLIGGALTPFLESGGHDVSGWCDGHPSPAEKSPGTPPPGRSTRTRWKGSTR